MMLGARGDLFVVLWGWSLECSDFRKEHPLSTALTRI